MAHMPGDLGCMIDDHCYSHNVDESSVGGIYTVCGECGHMYMTAGELRRAYRRKAWQAHRASAKWSSRSAHPQFSGPSTWSVLWRILTIRAKKIYFCQHCIHDF